MKHFLAFAFLFASAARAETYCLINAYDGGREVASLFDGVVKDQDTFVFAREGLRRDFNFAGKHHVSELMKLHGARYVLVGRSAGNLITLTVGHFEWFRRDVKAVDTTYAIDAIAVAGDDKLAALIVPAAKLSVNCFPTAPKTP